jgi:hypothetical protein
MLTFSAPYSSARITLESGRSSCRRYAQHRRSAANFHRWNSQRLTTTGVEVVRPHRYPVPRMELIGSPVSGKTPSRHLE